MRTSACMLTALAVCCSTAVAQLKIDGRAWDVNYGPALAVQDTDTGFGNSTIGRPDAANGSELDAFYGVIVGGNLYITVAGNLETTSFTNKLEFFIDSRAGGQNKLVFQNPSSASVPGLARMSDADANVVDPNSDGLKFTPGFTADYYISVTTAGLPRQLNVDYAELYVDAGNPGVAYDCGTAPASPCLNADGTLSGAEPGAPAIKANIDNSNVVGVGGSGGSGGTDPSLVNTGIEICVPLSAIGNPSGSINVTVFVNGASHDFVSNQFLWGLFGGGNLGEPRAIDLSPTAHFPVTVPVAPALLGSCCNGSSCSITTQAACGGTWIANGSCDGNPCDGAFGRCCINNGTPAGECRVVADMAECTSLGGTFTPNINCDGCPCYDNPTGACCVADVCTVTTFFGCAGQWFGAGTTCSPSPCNTPNFPAPYVAGDVDPNFTWCPTCQPMTSLGNNKWYLTYLNRTPGQRYEFKITNGLDWGAAGHKNWPPSNSYVYGGADGTITIYFDGNYYVGPNADGWWPERDRIGVSVDQPGGWSAAGSYVSELGGNDWTPTDPFAAMTQQPDGTWYKAGTGLPAGQYFFKFTDAADGSFRGISEYRSTSSGSDRSFTVANPTDTVKFYLDEENGRVRWEVVAAPPTGACCFPDGSCTVTTQAACTGSWQGAGTNCSPNLCPPPPPTGACCVGAVCSVTTEAACSGDWLGAGTDCDPNPCVQYCLGDSDCDGDVDFFDIDPFVAKLGCPGGAGCDAPCPWQNSDVDEDGDVDFFDIDPFVARLGASCP